MIPIQSGVSKDFSPQDTSEDVQSRIETKMEEKILPGPLPGRWSCPLCEKTMLVKNNRRHLEKQHPELTKDQIKEVLDTGLAPAEAEPVFSNAVGAVLTDWAFTGLTLFKRKRLNDPKASFEMAPEQVAELVNLHQALAEKYLGPVIGEYSIEVSAGMIWFGALYANFAGENNAPPLNPSD